VHVTASGVGVPTRCICSKAANLTRCVCIGGPIAELASGLDRILSNRETVALLDPAEVILDTWTQMLARVAGAVPCHGRRNADVDARLEAEPSWSTSAVELHAPPWHEASGERRICYTAKKECAVLVKDSSAPGQKLRVRTVPSDEPAPRREESGSDEEERFAAESTVGLCDTC
jgi:hypothetical protein